MIIKDVKEYVIFLFFVMACIVYIALDLFVGLFVEREKYD